MERWETASWDGVWLRPACFWAGRKKGPKATGKNKEGARGTCRSPNKSRRMQAATTHQGFRECRGLGSGQCEKKANNFHRGECGSTETTVQTELLISVRLSPTWQEKAVSAQMKGGRRQRRKEGREDTRMTHEPVTPALHPHAD